MADHEYYAKLGVNASEAVRGFGEASKSAAALTNTLGTLETALGGVKKRTTEEAAALKSTLGLYQQLGSAANGYARAMKGLSDPAVAKGAREMEGAFKNMRAELDRIGKSGFSKQQSEQLTRSLELYKRLAQASQTYTGSLKNEAQAIKAVADAEARRQNISRAAANAQTRQGGTDIWGVTKDERNDRQRANVVEQARREMAAEFAVREEGQRKLAALQTRARQEMERDFAARETKVRAGANMQVRANTEMEMSQRNLATMQMRARREMDADFEKRLRNAGATGQLTAQEQAYERQLASTRYALYEVAAAYTALAAASAALPLAGIAAAVEMEQQFAHVARTTQASDGALESLRGRFEDLSTEIPITFEELSKIGTLGAQMGIASGDLESFADTVGKFAATTNVTAENAAMSFGRLANMMHLAEDDFRNLGSGISELGTASVATEAEILAIAESVATTANMAGFSADEVIGLSTALASLRVRPEMARGAMQRIFASINASASEGAEGLRVYADAMGVSAQAAEAMYRNDPSQFLQRISQAIGEMDDNVARSQFIREGLGFKNVRDVEMLNRLANGYEVYADSMTLAQDAYARGDYLDAESGVIFETTAAHIERLGSAVKAMLASFGNDSLTPINLLAEALIGILNAIRDMPSVGKNVVVGVGGIIAVFAALKAAMALSMATMMAFRLMAQNMDMEGGVTFRNLLHQSSLTFPGMKAQIDSTTASLGAFKTSLATTPGAMGKAAVAATGFGAAMKAIPVIGWVGLAATAVTALASWATAHDSAAEAARKHAEQFIESSGGMGTLVEALRKDAAELASGEQTEVYGRLNVRVKETGESAETASSALRNALIPAHEAQADAVRESTAAYEEGIGAIGEYTDLWLREGLAKNLSEKLSADQTKALIDAGFDFVELSRLMGSGGKEAAQAYINEFASQWDLGWSATGRLFDQMPDSLLSEDAANETGRVVRESVGIISSEMVDLNSGLDEINSKYMLGNALGVEMFDSIEEGADDSAGSVDTLGDAFDALIGGMFDLLDTQGAVIESFEALGESLAENGNSFDVMTEAGRANTSALRDYFSAVAADIEANVEAGIMSAEEGTTAFEGHILDVMSQLEAMGVDTSQFEDFITSLDQMFSEPVRVNVDTTAAQAEMDAAYSRAVALGNALANLTGKGTSTVFKPARGTGSHAVRAAAPRPGRTPAPYRDLPSIEAERTAAAQRKIREEQEKGSKATRDTADQAAKLREEIEKTNDPARLLEETIKELSSAFKDTIDKFEGFGAAQDSMESQLISMREAAEAAKEKVADLREEAAKLRREANEERVTAMESRIFAGVAGKYGDSVRQARYTNQAREAEAAAAKKDKEARKAAADATELDRTRNSLVGNSKQAIENREQMRRLYGTMSDLILKYAETGATTEEVTRFAEGLRRKFIEQGVQMGYNRGDVVRLSDVFKLLKQDIDRVPREVRIKALADTAEAQRKIRELGKDQTVNVRFRSPGQDFNVTGKLNVQEVTSPKATIRQMDVSGMGNGITSNWRAARGGVVPGRVPAGRSVDNMLGIGHSFDGTVMVQSGEGIVNRQAMNHYGGADWLNAVNTMTAPPIINVAAASTSGGGGTGTVDLSPRSMQILAQAVSTVLAVDGKVVAATTNAQNTAQARRGAN